MTISELRKIVKITFIAQNGKFYNFNICNIANAYGVEHCEVKNAMNYFYYSPQQAKFRTKYNIH